MPNYPKKNKGRGRGNEMSTQPVPGDYRAYPVYPQPMPAPKKGSKGKGRGNQGK